MGFGIGFGKYVLDENDQPILCDDILEWGKWIHYPKNKIVAKTRSNDLTIEVSTVFLGLDHSFTRGGPLVLWETMIFGGKHDQYCVRYTSKQAALEGHQATLLLMEKGGL